MRTYCRLQATQLVHLPTMSMSMYTMTILGTDGTDSRLVLDARGPPSPGQIHSRGCRFRRIPNPPETIAAEDIVHAISINSSDSQTRKCWRGSSPHMAHCH